MTHAWRRAWEQGYIHVYALYMYIFYNVHVYRYKRFLRSKDLSVVSSDDLNCVVGKRGRGREGRKRHMRSWEDRAGDRKVCSHTHIHTRVCV